ncbi:hypothetical protein JA1_001308 [Spathaspora sp. JA1]|nr:hypothetical protein JA1_001308 [Spathaspora sp. JA1]
MTEPATKVSPQLEKLSLEQANTIPPELVSELEVDINYKSYFFYTEYLHELSESKYTIDANIIHILSLHACDFNPWVNTNGVIVRTIISDIDIPDELIEDFIRNEYKRNLNSVKPPPVVTSRLGYNPIANEITSSEDIEKFKKFPVVLSNAWFLIEVSSTKLQENHWLTDEICRLTLSLVLNLIQVPDWQVKKQGCQLLNFLMSKLTIEKHTGFISEIRKLLNKYVMAFDAISDDAFVILNEMYKSYGTNLDFIELLNSLISLLNHLLVSELKIVEFCRIIKEIGVIVEQISIDVTICLSKLLFTFNQILVNVDLYEKMPRVLSYALKCQLVIIKQFTGCSNPKFKLQLYSYRMDLLGAWGILYRRVDSSKDWCRLRKLIKENMDEFEQLGNYKDWQDLSKLVSN